MTIDRPYYKSIFGSHLYGVATPESDTDYRGFWIPSRDELDVVVLTTPKQSTDMFPGEGDTVMYRLDEYLRLLSKGNGTLLEILYTPWADNMFHRRGTLDAHELQSLIIRLRKVMCGKHFYKHFKGFAFAEHQKALCQTRFPKDAQKPTHEILDQLGSRLQLKSYERTLITDLIEELRPDAELYEVRSTAAQVGDDRRTDLETYGYCRKNMYHAMRLLYEGLEYLRTGQLTFPLCSDALQDLIGIRAGKIHVDDCRVWFEVTSAKLDEAFAKSTLPAKPNIDAINQLYQHTLNTFN